MDKYVVAKMGDEFKPKDKGGTFFDAVTTSPSATASGSTLARPT